MRLPGHMPMQRVKNPHDSSDFPRDETGSWIWQNYTRTDNCGVIRIQASRNTEKENFK